MKKMLRKKIAYFKKIYNFGVDHFFIGYISFVYLSKILFKIKNSLSKENYVEYEENVREQNCSPPEDLKIYLILFFNKNKYFLF